MSCAKCAVQRKAIGFFQLRSNFICWKKSLMQGIESSAAKRLNAKMQKFAKEHSNLRHRDSPSFHLDNLLYLTQKGALAEKLIHWQETRDTRTGPQFTVPINPSKKEWLASKKHSKKRGIAMSHFVLISVKTPPAGKSRLALPFVGVAKLHLRPYSNKRTRFQWICTQILPVVQISLRFIQNESLWYNTTTI